MELMNKLMGWMRHYVSPVFLAFLVAAFFLWYIAKLSYTYSTRQEVRVEVDGVPIDVTCVVEGVGTNLFRYGAYMKKTLKVELKDLVYEECHDAGHEGKIRISPKSLQSAIAVHLSDIKILSVDAVPEIDIPEKKK